MMEYSPFDAIVQQGSDNVSAQLECDIDNMYYAAQILAKEGNQGDGLSPPKDVLTCLSCNDNQEHYMEAEFRNCDTDDTFKKWITKKEAIKELEFVIVTHNHLRFVTYIFFFFFLSLLFQAWVSVS